MSIRDSEMTGARFAALLDAYGASPDRWPDGERRAAMAYCRHSAGAKAALERAAALDSVLDRATVDTRPGRALYRRVHALATDRTGHDRTDRKPPRAALWRRAVPGTAAGWQRHRADTGLFRAFALPDLSLCIRQKCEQPFLNHPLSD